MKRYTLMGTILFACLGAPACSTEPVMRHVTLAPGPSGIPAGTAAVKADEIEVEFSTAEPLASGKHHVLWAETRTATVALTIVEPDVHTEVIPADVGLAVTDIQEVFVTEEDEQAKLPTAPSTAIVVRGEVPGALLFGGTLMPMAFDEGAGQAVLADETITVTTSGLPELPSGFRYDVWVGFGSSSGPASAGHALVTKSAGHDSTPASSTSLQRISSLLGGALSLDTGRFLPLASEVRITVESDNGHTEDAASAQALTGFVAGTEPAAGAQGPGHLH